MQNAAFAEEPSSSEKPPPCRPDTSATTTSIPKAECAFACRKYDVKQWTDWRWQMRHRIRTIEDLREFFPSVRVGTGTVDAMATFPMAITPYYASVIRNLDDSDPVFRMIVPQGGELINPPHLHDDPLEEEEDMPVPGLVHRYPDRALLIATSTCSAYCRHCTRKRVAGHRETSISASRLTQAVAYLREHPEVKDVVISGGDPLTMSTAALESLIRAVRSVPTVEVIRIGSRVPVVMPMRIDRELVEMLRQFHPIFINTHFNHPNEITPESSAACQMLADAGIPIGNQTVLLRGVNDDPKVLEALFRGLLRMRVRPYYLFQCDLVRGVEHFRTPLSRGIEIMEYLRGRLSGLGIPAFVVDMPHGGGKIPVLPNYIVSTSPTHTVLRNFEGAIVAYPEPNEAALAMKPPRSESAPGVWEVASGRYTKIQPRQSVRHARRRQRIEARESAADLQLRLFTGEEADLHPASSRASNRG